MFTLISNVAGSLFWGALVALLAIGALFIVLKLSYSRFRISFLGGIILVIFTLFMFGQASLMAGAMQVRALVTDLRAVERLGQSFEPVADFLDESGLQGQLPSEVQAGVESGAQAAADSAQAVMDGTRDVLTSFVWRRVAWMSGAMVVAGFLLARTRKKTYSGIDYDQMTTLDF